MGVEVVDLGKPSVPHCVSQFNPRSTPWHPSPNGSLLPPRATGAHAKSRCAMPIGEPNYEASAISGPPTW